MGLRHELRSRFGFFVQRHRLLLEPPEPL